MIDLGIIHLINIRSFLENEVKFPESKVEKILVLLFECLKNSRKPSTSKIRNFLKNARKNNDSLCYICGEEVNYDQSGQHNSAQVEHVWPNSMGGSCHEDNLKISCKSCNQAKEDFIDTFDFHYEKMCFVNDKGDKRFSNELKGAFKVALWAKNQYKCKHCDEPVSSVGSLEFARRNNNDNWHFLNMDAYCSKHLPEE